MTTHACKVQFDSLGGLVPAANTSASMQDCADAMDTTAATLCLKHCAQGADSNNTVSTADVPSLALTAFLVVGPVATQLPTESRPRWPDQRDTSPPPLLLNRLRSTPLAPARIPSGMRAVLLCPLASSLSCAYSLPKHHVDRAEKPTLFSGNPHLRRPVCNTSRLRSGARSGFSVAPRSTPTRRGTFAPACQRGIRRQCRTRTRHRIESAPGPGATARPRQCPRHRPRCLQPDDGLHDHASDRRRAGVH